MKLAIIGKGNVGSHLYKAFSDNGVETYLLDSRSEKPIDYDPDIVLIAVSDKAILPVAESLKKRLQGHSAVVAHTSGSVGISVLESLFDNTGVFYPLQTFSRNIPIKNYSEIPVFIEANSKKSEEILIRLANIFSKKHYILDSNQRIKLHIASVVACNFVNALYGLAGDILKKSYIDFNVLVPLIKETASKIETCPPENCQTGPAARGDREIVEKHLSLLSDSPEAKEIYELLSTYLLKKHHYE